MPASLAYDMETKNGLEDQRALQLALELTMLGLSGPDGGGSNSSSDSDGVGSSFSDDARKKSQNMTECVPVPSSEHVAEIVGRQGCKIKALRAKTNTYIKTPVRGEEPVFVVTGRKEDVTMAKKEILSAAEHFSQIRASRKNNLNGSMAPGPPNIPGQVTIQVRVPYRVVGLVVGPKGATIKRIQQQTHTYIVTPSRDKEPVFEVTGLPDNVELAKKEIEAHIAMRTGGVFDGMVPPVEEDYAGMDGVNLSSANELVSTLYNKGLNGLNGLSTLNDLNNYNNYDSNNMLNGGSTTPPENIFYSSKADMNGFIYDNQSIIDNTSGIWGDLSKGLGLNGLGNGVTNGMSNGLPRRSNSVGSTGTPPSRLSPQLGEPHTPARRINSDPLQLATSLASLASMTTGVTTITTSSSPPNMRKRDCIVCYDSEVVSALVPCGHNFFCMECANRLCGQVDGECPVCHMKATQAIRIFS
jgi:RNA-binding protein MEX3